MSCTPIRDQLPGLLYGELTPDEAAAVRKHLAVCPACRKEHGELQRLRQALDAAPAAVAAVDLPALYQEAARRRQKQLRRWRRAAVALLAVAAALLVAFALNLEVRVEAHQFVIRWGAPPETVSSSSSMISSRSPPEVTAEEMDLVKEMIHALAADVRGRDAQQQQALARLRERLDAAQFQADERWAVTRRNEAAFYTALFKEKGVKP
jgi:Putative zinc-finger